MLDHSFKFVVVDLGAATGHVLVGRAEDFLDKPRYPFNPTRQYGLGNDELTLPPRTSPRF
jgi:hypothetical protein